jgi:hypothetical protein
MDVAASAVIVDLRENALRVVVPNLGLAPGSVIDGVLDVGANGRLLGVEVGDDYVRVMDAVAGDAFVRSATVRLTIPEVDPTTVRIPRHGPGYEITYPSGNQCWQVTSVGGRLIQLCATIAGEHAAPPGAPGPGLGRP